MAEGSIQRMIQLRCSECGSRVFRNQAGVYQIKKCKCKPVSVVASGLCKGASDLIGWRPTLITEDMVGKTVAVFIALEVKTLKGRIRPEQAAFLKRVQGDGGIAAVVRSPEEAEAVLELPPGGRVDGDQDT